MPRRRETLVSLMITRSRGELKSHHRDLMIVTEARIRKLHPLDRTPYPRARFHESFDRRQTAINRSETHRNAPARYCVTSRTARHGGRQRKKKCRTGHELVPRVVSPLLPSQLSLWLGIRKTPLTLACTSSFTNLERTWTGQTKKVSRGDSFPSIAYSQFEIER